MPELTTLPVQGTRPDFPHYRCYIEEALAYAGGSHTVDDVLGLIATGHAQFWPGERSVIITEIIQLPQKRVLNFFLAGGEPNSLDELARLEPIACAWGHAQGCSSATFCGRPGWQRSFVADAGWTKSKLVVLEKTLNGQEQR